jgi:tetratricopeptide (TPR) repeat protein
MSESIWKKCPKSDILFHRMKIFSIIVLLSCAGSRVHALQEWIIPLREAVYEQKLTANEIEPIYQAAKAASRERCSGTALDLALSRCEYFMGRALHYEKSNTEARAHYSEGMKLAEKALAASPSAEAWLLRSENLSQICSIGPWSYTVANGLNVEKFAKSALSLDGRNAAAQYLIAARWVFAPAPFHNHKKGIEMMMEIPKNGNMEKDDTFNVCLAIGYANIEQKKFADARPWIQKSLEIYPSNKFAAELLAKK